MSCEVAATGCNAAFWTCWAAGSEAAIKRLAGLTVTTPVPSTNASNNLGVTNLLCISLGLPASWEGSISLSSSSLKSVPAQTCCWCYARVVRRGKVVTCVYGTRDQWGHWPVVWKFGCLAVAAFAHGSAASSFVVNGEGISGR